MKTPLLSFYHCSIPIAYADGSTGTQIGKAARDVGLGYWVTSNGTRETYGITHLASGLRCGPFLIYDELTVQQAITYMAQIFDWNRSVASLQQDRGYLSACQRVTAYLDSEARTHPSLFARAEISEHAL